MITPRADTNGLALACSSCSDPRHGRPCEDVPRQIYHREPASTPARAWLRQAVYNVACVFSPLGLEEPALDRLEKAIRNGLRQKGWCEHDSNLDRLRSHQRFQELLREL